MATPIVLVDSGGVPATVTTLGAPMTPVATLGVAHTLISSGGRPVTLVSQTGDVFSGSLESESSTLLAAMSTAPTLSRQYAINALIYALKAASLWTKLDILQVFAAADSQAASLNWKNPATFTAAGVSSPTFTADQGYAGDGAASYVNTTWAPTNGVNYTQDSATLFAWSRTATGVSNPMIGTGTAVAVQMSPRTAGNAFNYRLNTAAAATSIASVTDGSGLVAISRSAAAVTQSYRNGATNGAAGSATSAALSAVAINVGRANSVFSTVQCAAWGAGANLSATEHAALYAALRTYMTAIGA